MQRDFCQCATAATINPDILAEITNTWRSVFDSVVKEFGGWSSLLAPNARPNISTERLYGIMVAKFRADSLFEATVQPNDKNSEKHVLLVSFFRQR